MSEESDEVTLEELVEVYRKIRDVRKANKQTFTKEDERLKAQQSLLAANILDIFNRTKQTSAKTRFGTAYKKLRTISSCSDWVTFYAWVKKNDAFQFLHKRITEKEVAQYREVHKELPPGVRVNEQYVIGILGANGKDEDGDD